VVALGELATELGDHLGGLDLNPVIVGPDSAHVVDALVLPADPAEVDAGRADTTG
jgi:hypothetical protein